MNRDELGRKHGTDKSSSLHHYLGVYQEVLEPYRARPELTVLEIGVRDGASVRMWQDFFPTAQIVGIDIMESCRQHADGRITVEIGDQADHCFLRSMGEKYAPDVVLDDGSHEWANQIDTFRMLFPYIKAGGIFICEDLHTSRSKHVEKYGRAYTEAAAPYFGRLAATFAAEGHVYGTMADAEFKAMQDRIEWVRFGRGFVIIKKS